jgi:phenylpropionate dioxygenase-like ring-hydroxylating dioxygenase large terminal subunit
MAAAIPEPGRHDGRSATVVHGLPGHYYTDPAIFEAEKRAIFHRTWQCLGHVSMLPEKGSYFTASIVDQDVFVARGDDDEVRAFYNVCRHRGHPLLAGAGTARRIVCPYHAWTYDTAGQLRTAPHTQGVTGFEPKDIRLNAVRVQVFMGLIFVNLDPAARDLRAAFGAIEGEVRAIRPNMEKQRLVFEYPMRHDCNWKASVEGFSECYHCAPVHKYLVDNVVDPTTYVLTVDGPIQRHRLKSRDGAMNQELWHLWPNLALGFYPIPGVGTVFCTRHMYAHAPDHSTYHYRWYADPGMDEARIVAYAKHHATTTGKEDAEVVIQVQRGMTSKGYDRALLIANPQKGDSTEHAIAAFHAQVLAALGHDHAR